MRNLSGQLANVDFTYRDPEKNFDRSKVKGVVARLIKVKDCSTMTALEVRGELLHIISFHELGHVSTLTLIQFAGYCWWKAV